MIVSLAPTAVAGLAVVASLVTTLLAVRAQRQNTRDTLDMQQRLSAAQERALHERSHAQDLRDKRAGPHLALIKCANRLPKALDEVAKPYLSLEEWNISPDLDHLLDLYALRPHPRALCRPARGLVGLVAGEAPRLPQLVTWTQADGEVETVRVETGLPLRSWPARAQSRAQLMDVALHLIAQVRTELQARVRDHLVADLT